MSSLNDKPVKTGLNATVPENVLSHISSFMNPQNRARVAKTSKQMQVSVRKNTVTDRMVYIIRNGLEMLHLHEALTKLMDDISIDGVKFHTSETAMPVGKNIFKSDDGTGYGIVVARVVRDAVTPIRTRSGRVTTTRSSTTGNIILHLVIPYLFATTLKLEPVLQAMYAPTYAGNRNWNDNIINMMYSVITKRPDLDITAIDSKNKTLPYHLCKNMSSPATIPFIEHILRMLETDKHPPSIKKNADTFMRDMGDVVLLHTLSTFAHPNAKALTDRYMKVFNGHVHFKNIRMSPRVLGVFATTLYTMNMDLLVFYLENGMPIEEEYYEDIEMRKDVERESNSSNLEAVLTYCDRVERILRAVEEFDKNQRKNNSLNVHLNYNARRSRMGHAMNTDT